VKIWYRLGGCALLTKHIVITGGCGFIGHHLIETILDHTNWCISVFDALSYASRGVERLQDIGALDSGRVRVFPVNLSRPIHDDVKKELGRVDYIVHMAAEVHVDKSIADPEKFIHSNIMGTFQMLQLAREIKSVSHFLYFSTDEVFGPALGGVPHKEWDRYNSTNPYSATKAAGEELALAWANTYGVPLTVTHCTNVFGERQNPEAFIPKMISMISKREKVRIHTNDKNTPGSRFYIHAADVADALMFLLTMKPSRDKFNISGSLEVSNLEVARSIADFLNAFLRYDLVSTDRPGCDFRYALDGSKLSNMGWRPLRNFSDSLKNTVRWYEKNPKWLEKRSSAVFGGLR